MDVTPDFLDSLRSVAWPATRVVRFGTPGAHPSRVRGPAPEFTEYRAFRQGDDPRRLDWKLLARTDRAFLRLTEDRATLGTMLILDASASMDFPAGPSSKWTAAHVLATGLAQVAFQSGDPVGLLVVGGGGQWLPPRGRRGVVREIDALLRASIPSGAARLSEISRHRVPRRVVVFSDFLDEEAAALGSLMGHLGAGGEVHAVHVIAREELEPGARTFTAVDPENEGIARAFGPAAFGEYRRRFAQWSAEVSARWLAAGAQWHEVVTDESASDVVRRITGDRA